MRATIVILFFWVFGWSGGLRAQPLFITEFMANNDSAWVDEAGEYRDWVELYNAGPEDIQLGGWYLTDRASNPLKQRLTDRVLPAQGFAVVATSFKLGNSGDYLALTNPASGSSHVVGVFPGQVADISYGYPMLGAVVLTNQPTYLRPTPGRRNGTRPQPSILALTEIMYQPISTEPGLVPDERLQFLELKNVGTEPLNLAGYSFIKGVEFTFTNQQLATGDYLIVVSNRLAFELRYGANPRIAGEFRGNLKNGGERILLRNPVGELVVDLNYDSTWRPLADGLGFSLVLKDDSAIPASYNRPEIWRNSAQPGGSPGLPDPAHAPPRVVVNEILAPAELPFEDVIELANLETNDVDISGWFLTDRRGSPRKFRIPEGTTIPGGGFLAFDEHSFNPFEDRASPTSFAFNEYGEEVWLFSADPVGNLTGYAHGFVFGAVETNVTFGRIVTDSGEEQFVPQSAMTFFETNAPPAVGPLVISEIMYSDALLPNGDGSFIRFKFIELHNITAEPVPLFDPQFPTNRWRLTNAVAFTFPEVVVPPFGYVMIGDIYPQAIFSARFRSTNVIPEDVLVLGPWIGSLSIAGETITLVRPDTPSAGVVPYLVVDQVRYSNQAPWPTVAAGFGASLNRINESDLGNNPANWRVALPNIGRPCPVGPVPVITTQPVALRTTNESIVTFTVTAEGTAPLTYHWARNGNPFINGPTITLGARDPRSAGLYSCTVVNPFGSATSSNVLLNFAEFPLDDTMPPTVIVQSPQRSPLILTDDHLTLTGTATDDVSLAGVFLQQNDGPWQLVSSTTNWTFIAALTATQTWLRVMAMDRAGNLSPTNVIEVHRFTKPPVFLTIHGRGFIRGVTNGQSLKRGARYSVTARPASGHRFVHWTDADGTVISIYPTYAFRPTNAVTLVATFVEASYFQDVQGSYAALFFDPVAPDHQRAGSLKFTVSRAGRFTGKLRLGGRTRPFVGALDTNLFSRLVLARGTTREMVVTLQWNRASDVITGTVSNAFLQAQLEGLCTMSGSGQAAAWAGTYPLEFLEPPDLGAASWHPFQLKIHPHGRFLFHGRLPGGARVAESGTLAISGAAVVHQGLHQGRGSLIGWLNVTHSVPPSADGTLLWSRTASTAHAGFNHQLVLAGLRTPSTNTNSAVELPLR